MDSSDRELMHTIWRGLCLMATDPSIGEAARRGLLLMIAALERRYGFKRRRARPSRSSRSAVPVAREPVAAALDSVGCDVV